MTINNLKTSIETRTANIKASEAVTKLELGLVSRELLLYIPDSKDIGAVNRLIEVLTPKNKEMAVLFFKNFLPWVWDDTASMFAGMVTGDAKRKRKFDAASKFIKSEDNNIWTWAKANIAPMERAKNYAAKIGSVIKNALADDKEGLSETEVFSAIIGAMTFETIANLVNQAIEEAARIEAEHANDNPPEVEAEVAAAE